jgi:hemolysin activation/secretion protein
LAAAWFLAALAAPASAQPTEPPGRQPAAGPSTQPSDLGPYRVSGFKLEYRTPHRDHWPLDAVSAILVTLGQVPDGFVRARADLPQVTKPLSALGREGNQYFYGSALQSIMEQIVQHYNRGGIMGVYVLAHPEDIDVDAEGKYADKRPNERTSLRLIIFTGRAKQVRTIASGERVGLRERVDNEKHRWIRENSPVHGERAAEPGSGDLLRKDEIDAYVLRLNRHPGRRVDVAVAAAENEGEVMLDYLITENRPWFVYGQVSNTGTKQTNEWRERFGFAHNQLTNHDDVLTLDYSTAGFGSSSQSVLGSYELPILRLDRLRMRVYGNWTDFTASDVGLAREQYKGAEWTAGGELIAEVGRVQGFFVDVFAGGMYESVEADQTEGKATVDFALPYAGVAIERLTDTSATNGELRLTYASAQSYKGTSAQGGGALDTDAKIRELLGRLDTDGDWWVIAGNLTHSFFLEPVLHPQAFKEAKTTLAHEVMLAAKWQYAFDYRLIPQAEETLGGFYTVRGYPESVRASDTVLIGTAEYRYHIARGLAVREPGRLLGSQFRYAPSRAYGRPDWDLILRGFVDVGRAVYTKPESPEQDTTLVGTGVGVEFQLKQNFSIRVDWGFALEGVGEKGSKDRVEPGDNRVHVTAILLY